MKNLLLITPIIMLLATGCASAPEDDQWVDERDPFETLNRDVWDFNLTLDEEVLLPTANAYEKIPKPVRKGLINAADNLSEVSSFVNNLLQGKFVDAGVTFWRFGINSTVGVLGIFDVATPIGLTSREEGFGEVLSSYGVMDGPYVMLPGLGPTVVTDRGGDVVDGMYFPIDNLTGPVSLARWVIKGLDKRLELREQEALMDNSLDSYGFVKEVYFQNWRYRVYDGNPPIEEDDELDDDFYDQF